MMKLIIVSRGIPTAKNPLSGIFEWDQALALCEAGMDITFIVLDLRSILHKRSFKTRCYQRDGINVVQGVLPLGAIPSRLFYHLARYKFRKLLNTAIKCFGKPDIIHGHFTNIGAIAASESKRLNIPCVVTEHSSSLNLDSLDSKTIYFARKAYSTATRLISVSMRLKNCLIQHFNVQSVVIPNVLDTTAIQFLPNKKSDDRIVFVATGNLLQLKAQELLVDAFATLPTKSSKLLIIGDGPERVNLEQQIKKLNLEDRVFLLGKKNRQEISKIYETSDCFVLPSRRETFGVVYIEAMLAGLPVIATRCGGPEDFVTPDNGLLIDVDNKDQLADALTIMLEKARTYSPELIHNYALENFGPQSIAKKLIEIYESII